MLELWYIHLWALVILIRTQKLTLIHASWHESHLAKVRLHWLLKVVNHRIAPITLGTYATNLGMWHRGLEVLGLSMRKRLELFSACIIKDLILLKIAITSLWLMNALTHGLILSTMAVWRVLVVIPESCWTTILHSVVLDWQLNFAGLATELMLWLYGVLLGRHRWATRFVLDGLLHVPCTKIKKIKVEFDFSSKNMWHLPCLRRG